MLKTVKRLLNFAGKYKNKLIQSIIIQVIYSICEAIPILVILYSLNCIIMAKEQGTNITMKTIGVAFFMMLISVIGRIVFGYVGNSKISMGCFYMCSDKRIEIGDRLKRMPMGYFNKNRLGEIASTVTTTIGDIEVMTGDAMTNVIVGIVHAVVITMMITFFNWKIGALSISAIVLGLFVNSILQKKSMAISPKRQQAQRGLVTAILEYIQGIAVIKSYGLGEKSNRAVDEAIEESRNRNIRLESIFTKLGAIYSYIFKIASCGMILLAGYLFRGEELLLIHTLGVIISSFVTYSYIETIGINTSILQLIDSSINKIEEVEHTPLMDENGTEIQPNNYNIEFKNVSFSYDTRKIIDHISLTIPQNTTVAIVGPSGGGKSTLCNLIARFWDVDEGEVLLGGHNVKEYTGESLLKNISMVFQNVYLFQDSIVNNIKFGRPEATMEEVIAAAKKARCHEFIMNLPNGYDTVIGEGGGSLSGGEKQRISIARAILKDAPIIILDEATSSVDPENEQQLQRAIEELTKQKTVIMIAHRLSTVRNADRIFVLSSGRIVEEGKHEELMEQNGIYHEFIQIRRKAIGWNL
ncbi:ABC transporter ATP-binding protein [Inediibacterium massiliense]|uniref:ABC transporter ATP-binding protein n=1 Tax=Inediibacterium massiliense TaxID=1658111 RepID=UPI0006B4839C|nr:ABC transporter ATP-binding protein [Inediibacterium massiliense]